MSRAYVAPVLALVIAAIAFAAASWRNGGATTVPADVAVVIGSHRPSPMRDNGDPTPAAGPANPAAFRSDPASLDPDMTARMSGLANGFADVEKRFATLKSEPRDPIWAPASERLLNRQYATIPYIGGKGRLLDIYCATDNCVVIGDLPRNTGRREVGTAMSALQSIDLIEAMMAQGFKDNGTGFGPSASDNRQMFVTFYKRIAPKQIKLR